MLDNTSTQDDPDAGQRAVIELPAESRAFVIAGPGAGKTWTLLRRAGTLTERDGLDASRLLVLSFTRAVVRELRRRDREDSTFASIFPETFDAFASRLLREASKDDRWTSGSYDARIQAATRLIVDGDAHEALARVGHVLVDEVQDLVGPRAEFVAALLRAHRGGFTAFGDPAQAIYDHERGATGMELIPELVNGLASEVVKLGGNHRMSGDSVPTVGRMRRALIDGDGEAGVERTRDVLMGIDSLGEFDVVPELLSTIRGTRAVLCRDNATALLISRALYAAGVAHRVRRATSDRPVAAWVAAAFDGSERLAKARYESRHQALVEAGLPGLPDLALGWRLLGKLDPGARGGAIRASEAGSRIALGRVPYELYDEPPCNLVISSIHRAKGLEFDRCVIIDWPAGETDDPLLEARVLFVALSRARTSSLHAGPRKIHKAPWFRSHKANDRLIKRGHKDWQTFGIEIRGDDVHATEPAGTVGFEADARTVQELMIDAVRPSDPVLLRYDGIHDFGHGEVPVYAVEHDRGPIGVTGERFGHALGHQLGKQFPELVTDLRVEDLETVKGPIETGDAAGLGRGGLWLRPRLVGLGDFTWKVR
jgi:hypothetical protein